ncbi:MAG: glycosyltransferase family 4 protein [Anaerolineales bacterium]
MKILLVGNYFYPEHTGGVEIVSYNLVKHYKENGCDVLWVAADVPPKFRQAGAGDLPVRSWNFTEERLGFPSPIPFPGDLAKLYRGVKWCDIVHLQDSLYPINIFIFIFSKLLRKPVLLTQYAKFIPYSQFYKRVIQSMAYWTVGKWMFSTADRTVFITANVRDNMQYLNPKKMREVVPLGVDTVFYSPISANERDEVRKRITGNITTPLILFVGRMVERKGVHLLKPLIERHGEWHWVMVGRPDDYDPGEWNFPNLTYFRNASENDLRELYASADLLVHPSTGEGVTLIASESLASGTPVVISENLYMRSMRRIRICFLQPNPMLIPLSKVWHRLY